MKKSNFPFTNQPSKNNSELLLLGKYTDDWVGCTKLINDLSSFQYELSLIAKAKGRTISGSDFFFKLSNETRINPAFYSLIPSFLHWPGFRTIYDTKWKNLFDSMETGNVPQKIVDSTNITWINVNSIFPNYEDKGVVIVNTLDNDKKDVITTSDGRKVSNNPEKWMKNISNVLDVLNKFCIGKVELKQHEDYFIKYIAGEVLANTFQHAFKGRGASSIGIFIEADTREAIIVISDRGITIPGNVSKKVSESIAPADAIDWALQRGNTTKDESKQGGMGLYRVKSLILSVDGEFAFRSQHGSVFCKGDQLTKNNHFYNTPGTVFYAKIVLDNIKEDWIKIDDEDWKKLKGVFDGKTNSN